MVLAIIGVQKKFVNYVARYFGFAFHHKVASMRPSLPAPYFFVLLKGADGLGLRLDVSPYRHVVTEI